MGGGNIRGNEEGEEWPSGVVLPTMEAMARCNPPLLEVTQISKEAADATTHYSENHHQLFMLKGRLRQTLNPKP